MSEKEPTVQRLNQRAREQIGQQLRHYYGSCIGEELPPRLLAVLKKLDEEMESNQEQFSATTNSSEPLAWAIGSITVGHATIQSSITTICVNPCFSEAGPSAWESHPLACLHTLVYCSFAQPTALDLFQMFYQVMQSQISGKEATRFHFLVTEK